MLDKTERALSLLCSNKSRELRELLPKRVKTKLGAEEMGKWEGECQNGFHPNLGFLPNLENFELLSFTTAQGVEDRTSVILCGACSKSSPTYKWDPKGPLPPQPWKKSEWKIKPHCRKRQKICFS